MERFFKFLIYLLFFLIPWQTRLIWRPGILNNGNWEYGIVGIFATEILLWLFGLFFIFNGGLKNWRFSRQRQLFLLVILVFCLSNFLVASDKLIFVQQLMHLVEVGFLFWLIKKGNFNPMVLFWSFIGGLTVQALLGIYQFLLQTTFASRWLGLTLHNSALAGSSILENWNGRWLRAYGGLAHPNILGGYLAVGILLIFIFLVFYLNNKKQRVVALVSLGVFSLALFFTFSRSAWLAVGGGLIVFLIILWQQNRGLVKKVYSALFLLIFFFSFLSFLYQPLVFGRLTGQGRLESQSNLERLNSYEEAKQVFKNNFWLGVGLGNYTLAVYEKKDSQRESWDYQPVHNALILSLIELGLVGCFLFSFYLFSFFKKNLRIIFCPLIFGLFFLSLFDHYLWSTLSGLWLVILVFVFATNLKPELLTKS